MNIYNNHLHLVDRAVNGTKALYKDAEIQTLGDYYDCMFPAVNEFLADLVLANSDPESIDIDSKDFARNISHCMRLLNDYRTLVDMLDDHIRYKQRKDEILKQAQGTGS